MSIAHIAGATLCAVLLLQQAQSLAMTRISMWTHGVFETDRDVYLESVKAFNAANKDVRIDLFFGLRRGEYNAQLDAAADEGRLPCLFDVDGPNAYRYARAGRLIALDQFSFVRDLKSRMLWTVVQQGTYKGKLFTLGQYDSGLAIWGNRRLLDKAGVRIPASPKTAWSGDEFEDVLARLKAAGVASPLEMHVGHGSPDWTVHAMTPILQSYGGDLIDRKTYKSAEGVLNGPDSVKALRAVQKWVKKEYVNADTPAGELFVQGKAALSYSGHQSFARFRKMLGDDLVLIPMPRFGARAVTASGSWSWGISSDCPHPAEAAKVLEHLMSEREVSRMAEATGALPALSSTFSRSKHFGSGGPLKVYFDQMFEGMVRPGIRTPAYPFIAAVFDEVMRAILKGADVRQELDKAARRIDDFIREKKHYPDD